MGDRSDVFNSTYKAHDTVCSEMGGKLDICMLFDLLSSNGTVELGPANRKGIISYLVNFGHNVTWIISQRNEVGVQHFRHGLVSVVATPQTHFFNSSSLIGKALGRTINTPQRMRSILKLIREEEYNVIYVHSDIPDGLTAIYIKRKLKIPFVFDLEPLGMVWEVYNIKSKRLRAISYIVAKIHDRLTIYIMKKADLITPSSKWFGEALAKRGIPEGKIMPYPNGVDIAKLASKDSQDICTKYQMCDSKVIIYVGTMDEARDLSVLIKAFSKVRKQREKTKLLMVGEGNNRRTLQELARELEIVEDVIFTGQVPGSQIPKFVAAADIGVSAVSPLACHIIGSPIKMFEYMGGGKPVVANEEILDQKEVVAQSGGGILVPFTSEAFADAIIELLDNPERAAEMGIRGREWVTENRSYEVLARQIERRLTELVFTERRQN